MSVGLGSRPAVQQPVAPEPGRTAKIYSTFLPFVPVLHLYSARLPGVTLAELILMLFAVPALFARDLPTPAGRRPVRTVTALLVVGFATISALAVILGSGPLSMTDLVARLAKLSVWALVTTFVTWRLFVPRIAWRTLRVVVVVASVYLLAQWLAWQQGGVFLPPVLEQEVFPPLQESYRDAEALQAHYTDFYVRPASFFGEPAYFGYYVLLSLVLGLFHERGHRPAGHWAVLVFISFAAIVSTSTTALYLVPLTWLIWIVQRALRRAGPRFVLALLGALVVGVGVAAYWEATSGMLSSVVSSAVAAAEKLADWESTARLGGSFEAFGYPRGVEVLVGVGMGNEDHAFDLPRFYNDLTTVFLGTGVLGLLCLVAYWLRLWRTAPAGMHLLVAWYVVISFGEQFLYQGTSFLLLAFVLYGHRKTDPTPTVPATAEPAPDTRR